MAAAAGIGGSAREARAGQARGRHASRRRLGAADLDHQAMCSVSFQKLEAPPPDLVKAIGQEAIVHRQTRGEQVFNLNVKISLCQNLLRAPEGVWQVQLELGGQHTSPLNGEIQSREPQSRKTGDPVGRALELISFTTVCNLLETVCQPTRDGRSTHEKMAAAAEPLPPRRCGHSLGMRDSRHPIWQL